MSGEPNTSNLLGLARTALIAGNSEEALSYFNRVLEVDPTISEAWMGKGKAAGWLSSLANLRFNEMQIAFNHAIATAPDDEKIAVTNQAVEEANQLVVALYGVARNHVVEYVALDGTWVKYVGQIGQMIDVLEDVKSWAPSTRVTLENIVHLCKDNIEGMSYHDPYNNNAPSSWHLSPEYEALLKSRMDAAVVAIATQDPAYCAPTIEKKKAEACFVVTATMGDFDHPTVRLIRQFRDEWLLHKPWGTRMIAVYYRTGPIAAKFISRSRILRTLSLIFLVRPAAWIAKRTLR